MQGQEHDQLGLSAVALARYALGGAQTRALDPIEFDLMIAAAFESVSVFNAITADPDPQRLKELTTRLRRAAEEGSSGARAVLPAGSPARNFTPSQTVSSRPSATSASPTSSRGTSRGRSARRASSTASLAPT